VSETLDRPKAMPLRHQAITQVQLAEVSETIWSARFDSWI